MHVNKYYFKICFNIFFISLFSLLRDSALRVSRSKIKSTIYRPPYILQQDAWAAAVLSDFL